MKARGQPQAQLDPGAEATSTEVYLFQRQLGFLCGGLHPQSGPPAQGVKRAPSSRLTTLFPVGDQSRNENPPAYRFWQSLHPILIDLV